MATVTSDAPSESDHQALAISREITETIITTSGDSGLRERLKLLARTLTKCQGVRGAAIVAFDEEEAPLTSGAYNLVLDEDLPELVTLLRLRQLMAERLHGESWLCIGSSCISRKEETVWCRSLRSADRSVGLVLGTLDSTVGLLDSTEAVHRSLALVSETTSFLAAAISSFIHQQAWSRIEKLQQLARKTLSQRPWNFQPMVNSLCDYFDAGAVTLFLREREELHLSAATDPYLNSARLVAYKVGEGLTGHVFKTGHSLRLSNSEDPDEVFRATGLDRKGPRHAERDSKGAPTVQFLGVPLRFGANAVGVLRMARKEGVARFTREDEKALQFFADLLGAAVGPTWDLLLNRSILESVTEAIAISGWERGAEGHGFSRIVKANPGAENLLGWKEDELVGRDAREIYAPGEYERISHELKTARMAARQDGHSEYGPILSKMQKADGSVVPVSISYRLLSNQLLRRPTLYTVGLAREASKVERQAEQHQRLLELLGAMKVAYFRANLGGITQESTPTDSEITGFSPEELRTLPREQLYPDPGIREGLLGKAREKGHLSREVVQMKRRNGELFWAEGDLRILKDQQGEEIGYEGLYRDMTDRIRLQGFLNEDTRYVLTDQQLFTKMKRDAEFHLDYLSSLSHQLLTPLGALIETLRNFERGELDKKTLQQRLPYVIGQALACTRMVRNLSYMDKILRGQPFVPENVPLGKLVAETKIDFLHLLEEKKLDLRVDKASLERHVPIQGHIEMIRQVIVNLTDNAIKYSLPETTIRIRGRRRSGMGALEFSNQGLRISAEDQESIFERGFRTPDAEAWVPHGTGLGLWLVRKIVEAHGATIHCLEVLESGRPRTLFRILFPGTGPKPSGGLYDRTAFRAHRRRSGRRSGLAH
jgi:PAS domain S-box-containing protein